ncbi:MAG: GIY-YIG nuclease family protein [Microbacteriaceae bacterium]
MNDCAIEGCGASADPDSPVELCTDHLLAAYDYVARDVGVTDTLEQPCLACGSRVGVRFASGWVCAVCDWRVGELPDTEIPPPRVDVVYYLRVRDRIKIGTSGNPRGRFGQIWHDELLAFERGGRVIEQRRHKQFAGFRLGRTEYFEPHPALNAHIAHLRAGVDDPWQQYSAWSSQAIALRG